MVDIAEEEIDLVGGLRGDLAGRGGEVEFEELGERGGGDLAVPSTRRERGLASEISTR